MFTQTNVPPVVLQAVVGEVQQYKGFPGEVGEGVLVRVGVCEIVRVRVCDIVAVRVGVCDIVAVRVGVGVGVGHEVGPDVIE